MNTKKAFYNVLSNIINQVMIILTGLVITRLFISYYGSAVNGMVGGIEQIIGALYILEAGVGAAAILALYKPLGENDNAKIGKVLGATRSFYYKSGILYVAIILFLLIFYPSMTSNQIDAYSIRLMIIILSSGGVIDYFFFGKYQVLLTADQKLYVINNYKTISLVISSIVVVWLILGGYSYILVKLVGAIVLLLRFIVVKIYININYKNLKIDSDFKEINLHQRWGAFVHQISTAVVFNTGIIIISIFLKGNSFVVASVYIIYNYIYTATVNLVGSFSSAIVPSFGNLYHFNSSEKIKETYQNYEFITFNILFVVYTSFSILLLPFIKVYTNNIDDANYTDKYVAFLFCLIAILQAIRMPANTIIAAAGHYKETQIQAIAEALINILLGILLINKLGIYGVLIAGVVSYLYRSLDMIFYNNKYLVKGSLKITIKRLFINIITLIFTCFIFSYVHINIDSFVDWIIYAVITVLIVLIIYIIIGYIFEKEEIKNFYNRLQVLFKSFVNK